jgi:hypothetical protein
MPYVQNINGLPLMPCSEAKARHLLEERKAVIVNRTPGVDAGYKTIGLSATTETKVLFEVEAENRTGVRKLIEARRSLRKSRRNRKTRYRAPRFDNRRRPDGWLPPSVEQRVRTHESAIKLVTRLLPVTKIIVEVAAFDIQKINNPDIEGSDYQNGAQKGYENVKAYVRERDNCTCQCCRGRTKDKRLEVHHLVHRRDGGSNRPENLITLCKTCHDKYHAGEIKLTDVKPKAGFRGAAFMTSTRWVLVNRLKAEYGDDKVSATYGYITKCDREDAGLEKTHYVDARCISGNLNAESDGRVYKMTKCRCHDRQTHESMPRKHSTIRRRTCAPHRIKGYRMFDTVRYNDMLCRIYARRSSGYFDIRKPDGTKISAGMSYRKLEPVQHSGNFTFTQLLPLGKPRGFR